jgi:dephospho-CoA kinase
LADERERYAKPGQVVVHVVPLLFETGYVDRVDRSIVVIAPDDERIRRVVQRDRMSEQQVRSRMASQIDPQEARRRATYCIENDGDISHLRERTRAVYDMLAQAGHDGK